MTAADEPDFYVLLGVPADATRAEIVRAFRRSALSHHPDRGGDADAFRGLRQAYETLSDPVRRKAYDRRRTSASCGAPVADAEPPPAADPFEWTSGAGPRTGAGSGNLRDQGVQAGSFAVHDPDRSWRRDDRFAWWKPVEEPGRKRRRR
ncbi:J domain-containing protein [Streptomyces sp. MBT65]|uniref:J domain-containing protein n=1 Tax=Streptomyces sp. MBT65 TaxID=1488395 RepID=UPI001909AD3C|nr:J domain-containing protein [Streptomyces sp. MBT65]MBK3573230.1 J domain-containing protein [Streptomyces sp. MBT65]